MKNNSRSINKTASKLVNRNNINLTNVQRSLRVKTILAVVISLLVSSPISSFINSYVRQFVEGSYGVLVNTGVTLLIATSIITLFIHFIVIKPLNEVVQAAQNVADGDLTSTVNYQSKDEIGQLSTAFNAMIESLRQLVNKTSETVVQVASYSEELKSGAEQNGKAIEQISISIQEVVAGAEHQVNTFLELSKSSREISMGMQQSNTAINSMATLSSTASKKANVGFESVVETIEHMNVVQASVTETSQVVNTLGNKSSEIGSIVNIITQLANQTNLLALNAAIEAARAGVNGKGFAVVADEVRKLAEQSASAAGNIQELIKVIQSETDKAVNAINSGKVIVEKGIDMVNLSGESFKDIVRDIQEVSRQSQEVATIVEKANKQSQNMSSMIENIAAISEQTSGSTQQVAASVEEQNASMDEITTSALMLNKMAQGLQENINKFKTIN
jgi:methyl-accepting chemotaxis protein